MPTTPKIIKKNKDINIAFRILGNELNRALIDILRPSFREIILKGLRTLSILMILNAFKLI